MVQDRLGGRIAWSELSSWRKGSSRHIEKHSGTVPQYHGATTQVTGRYNTGHWAAVGHRYYAAMVTALLSSAHTAATLLILQDQSLCHLLCRSTTTQDSSLDH